MGPSLSVLKDRPWDLWFFVIAPPLLSHLGLADLEKIVVQRVVRAVCDQLRQPVPSQYFFWNLIPLLTGKGGGQVTSAEGVARILPVLTFL